MKLPDLLELASGNLRNSLLRNGLTTIGISVGIASLVAMLSLGIGLQQLAGQRLSRSGLFDTVVVSAWRSVEQMERDGRRDGAPLPASGIPAVLDEDARRHIEQLPAVLEAQPEIRFVGEIRIGGESFITSVAGLPPSSRNDEAFDSLQGSFFSSPQAAEAIVRLEFAEEWDEQNPRAILGKELVLRYAERRPLPPEPAGDSGLSTEGSDGESGDDSYGFTVVRRELRCRVVGLIEQEPFGGMRSSSRARVYLPTGLVETLDIMQSSDMRGAVQAERMQKTYDSLMARVSSPAQVAEVEQAIRRMGFRTFSILDATRSLQRFFVILDLFLGIFGSMALAVASLGIVNTLVMAVLERRREIGILKALGASDGDIRRLFFAEAGAMGLAGGAIGVAIGWGIARAINWGTAYYLAQRDFPPETVAAVPWWLVGAAVVFAVLVSLAAGIYPASRAARLDPVQAIRYE
ncbi:MAG TPA: ABC transporter permease [Terriglobia bacterium]|nr:ABC transporter permease [Terriglobia bacterium]